MPTSPVAWLKIELTILVRRHSYSICEEQAHTCLMGSEVERLLSVFQRKMAEWQQLRCGECKRPL